MNHQQRPLLDNINSPEDLRKLSKDELSGLCTELRDELVDILSQIGGHFASSLGAVELTVALHWVLNTPEDRIVWDTGHQAYIHKIITGRRKSLAKVRKLGGISGFPSRDESNYDNFGVAHAGTSISAAFGMLEASFHEYPGRKDRKVVAVIGDGAMTAGMAFEALNHSGQLHRNLIVILNDNEMSIAPNVGALSWAFSKTVTGPRSTYVRKHFKNLHEKGLVPHSFYRALDRAEEATKGFLSTPAMLFESFGYKYMGPIDGHNVEQVVEALERACDQDGPVLIHARTLKGKGFLPAEGDPVKWHGVGPFDPSEGEVKKSGKPASAPSYTGVFGDTMVELCEKDPRVVGVTAAMPHGTGLLKLSEEMPDRYFDAGIAEQHAVTFAAGLACEGMKPFCTIYSTFLQRGFDQVLHDVCIQSLPVVFAMDRAGLVGADGPTHHGAFDISFLRPLPNMVIMAPKDEAELRDMMFTAADYEEGPIAFRYPRGSGTGADLAREPKKLIIGKAEVLRHADAENEQVLLLAIGVTVKFAREAAEKLASEYGVECTVVNSRFIKPLDADLITKLAASHSLIVTVEDGCTKGGFGSEVIELLCDEELVGNKQVIRLGIPDKFIEHGTQEELYRICGFDADGITERVAFALGKSRPQKAMTVGG